ncbi:MAG: DUF1566 domain-containing protein [Desulfuromonas sp.]
MKKTEWRKWLVTLGCCLLAACGGGGGGGGGSASTPPPVDPGAPPVEAVRLLNDSGIQSFGDANVNNLTSAPAGFPWQDAALGRDAAAAAGSLQKTGGGAAGFDFSRIGIDGAVVSAAELGSKTWVAVRDNTTALMWEVKTNDYGLRDARWLYRRSAAADGAGVPGEDDCIADNGCDVDSYIARVNAAGLAGYSDWRLPTREELRSLVHYGTAGPVIDGSYFPDTPNDNTAYWTDTDDPASETDGGVVENAWVTEFCCGMEESVKKDSMLHVRLVRETGSPARQILVAHADGSVTHLASQLRWQICPEGQIWDAQNGCGGSETLTTWSEAQALADAVSGWRLPTADELQALARYYQLRQQHPEWLLPDAFAASAVARSWSSTADPQDGDRALAVDFRSGEQTSLLKEAPAVVEEEDEGEETAEEPAEEVSESEAFEPQAVRLVQEDQENYYLQDNRDGTVTDRFTGLMWKVCSEGEVWHPQSGCTGYAQQYNWQESLQQAQNVSAAGEAGHNDWRLPNIKELTSILNPYCTMPASYRYLPPASQQANYWTSSLYVVSQRNSAWTVDFGDGSIAPLLKFGRNYVRLVRDAR